MQQTTQMKVKLSKFMDQDNIYMQDVESNLKHMDGFDLTDSEVEFLSMKKMKTKRDRYANYAPDPRLGDYEA